MDLVFVEDQFIKIRREAVFTHKEGMMSYDVGRVDGKMLVPVKSLPSARSSARSKEACSIRSLKRKRMHNASRASLCFHAI